MSAFSSVVAIYDTHAQAEEAVKELQRSRFDMKKISIVGKDYHTEEHVVGHEYPTRYWMMEPFKFGAFWGGIGDCSSGTAFFAIPGIGPVLVAGPLVGWIVAALEGAAVVGGMSALGGRALQHRHSEGQRAEGPVGAQDGQVRARGARSGG